MPTLTSWVERYVGLPFVDRGRTRQGLDCWGLVALVLKEQYSIEVESYVEQYDSVTNREEVTALFNGAPEGSRWRQVARPKEGDLILLRQQGFPMHVGIVCGDGQFLHTLPKCNAVIDDYTREHWKLRVLGFYRHITRQ